MSQTILVLEDEALIAMDIEDTLLGAGYGAVVVCHNLRTALAEIAAHRPVFAFLDLNLGQDETSVEVARELLRQDVPFSFLSGYTKTTVSLPEDLAGAPRMSKPFKSADLVQRVEQALAASG